MKVAIVDLGTNSLRFDIFDISPSGRKKLLHREKDMIRLGAGVFSKHRIAPEAKARVLKHFDRVAAISKKHGVKKMICYATSALRAAKDTQQLLTQIKKRTGCGLRVISGKREAELIAKGILRYHRCQRKTILIDIGGGSSEFTACYKSRIIKSESIQLGSMRIQNMYLKKHPPSDKAILITQAAIRQTLSRQAKGLQKLHYTRAIGSGGTIKALLRVTRSKGSILKLRNLEHLFDKIRTYSLPKLKSILKTEGRRGDIILAGTLLLIEVLTFFNLTQVSVSTRGLRDGILAEQISHGKI